MADASLILTLMVREGSSTAGVIGGISNRMLGLVAGAAGVTAAIGSSITKAADFDLTIRQVGAAANVAGAELKTLSDLALKMGSETSFSASQAATAMLELAKGGLTSAQIQAGALKGTLTLAAAGGIELADAATVMSNSLNGFGLQATDAAAVAAAFAGGANASSASVESLTQALMQVGPGAKTAGLSLQDTVGVLAAFDQNMLKGSDAGTSLKTLLSRLVPQTDAAATAMRNLGLNFVNAQGGFVSITEVAGQLQTAFSKLSASQKTQALNDIFGADAARAGALLAKEGAAGIAKYITATKDLGAAQRMADTNTSGFKGAMEQFKGSIETLQITLGLKLLPILTPVVKGFTNLSNAALGAVEPVARVAGGIGSAFKDAFSFDDLAKAKGDAAAANLGGLRGVAQDLGRGIGVAFAGISGQSELGEFDGPFRAINDAAVKLGASLPAVRDQLADLASAVGGAAGTAWDLFKGALLDVGEFLGAYVIPSVLNLVDLLSPLLADTLRVAGTVAGAVLKPALAAIGAVLTDVVGPALKAVTGFLADNKTIVQALAVTIGVGIATYSAMRFATIAWGVATNAVTVAMNIARGAVVSMRIAMWLLNTAFLANPIGITVAAVAGLAAGLVYLYKRSETFRDIVQSMFGWVTDLGGAFGKVADVVTALPGKLADLGGVLLDAGKDLAGGLWDGISSVVTGIGKSLFDLVKKSISGYLAVGQWLYSTGKDLLIGMWNGVAAWTGELFSRVAGLPAKILESLGDTGRWLFNAGKNVIIGLWNGFVSMADWLRDKVIGFIKWAIPDPILKVLGIASPSKVGVGIGANFAESIGLGVQDAAGSAAGAAAALGRSVQDAASGLRVSGVTVPVTAANVGDLSVAAQADALAALAAARAGGLAGPPQPGTAGAPLTEEQVRRAVAAGVADALRREGVSDVTTAVAQAAVDPGSLSRAQGRRTDLMGRI